MRASRCLGRGEFVGERVISIPVVGGLVAIAIRPVGLEQEHQRRVRVLGHGSGDLSLVEVRRLNAVDSPPARFGLELVDRSLERVRPAGREVFVGGPEGIGVASGYPGRLSG